jgi:N utilization substance protein A
MTISLSDAARQYLALLEEITGATGRDCLVDDEDDRVVMVVSASEMGQAIGPGGRNVNRLEERIDKDVELVEDADEPAEFVANALAPAAVYNVTISENEDVVAYAEVAHEDQGVAIGAGGKNIETARELAKRHFDIADVQLT